MTQEGKFLLKNLDDVRNYEGFVLGIKGKISERKGMMYRWLNSRYFYIFASYSWWKKKMQWNLQLDYKYLQICEKNNPKYTQYNIWRVKQISVQDSLS